MDEMTQASTQPESTTQTVTVEREMPYPPEKVWRALTESGLIDQWLMKNDFQPVVDHRFKFTADWGSVDGRVLKIEPNKSLAYTWEAYGLESVITWTLTPTGTGTHIRMDQSGFRQDQQQAYNGARHGWQKFFDNLDQVVKGL
jgi:uncharacterized protein YndB with AHSA1/START domain